MRAIKMAAVIIASIATSLVVSEINIQKSVLLVSAQEADGVRGGYSFDDLHIKDDQGTYEGCITENCTKQKDDIDNWINVGSGLGYKIRQVLCVDEDMCVYAQVSSTECQVPDSTGG